jgi:hypothetical protein
MIEIPLYVLYFGTFCVGYTLGNAFIFLVNLVTGRF